MTKPDAKTSGASAPPEADTSEGTRATDRAPVPERLAAVDLGSNSFHMVVARNLDGRPQIVDRLREPVRLGMGVTRKGRLSREAQDRAIRCLERFGERIRHLPPNAVRAVGTNAFRAARRAQDFVERASEALGHEIEIISGQEEARLVHLGVMHSTHTPGANCLVIDIGGGSTEVIVGTRESIFSAHSLPMGCVSYSRRFFPDGEINAKRMRKARRVARLEIEPYAENYQGRWEHALGSSGTIRALVRFAREQEWTEGALDRRALKRVRRTIVEAESPDALVDAGFSETRSTVVAGGAAILSGLFDVLKIESISAADGALREGVLYDLAGRIEAADVRNGSIAHMQETYRVDTAQAARIAETTRRLYEQVYASWSLPGPEGLRVLQWSAAVHEIGLSIAHARHHRHAAYLLRYANLAGFSETNQRLIATLVGQQRGRIDLESIASLPTHRRESALRLLTLFRLAIDLHRSRHPARLPAIVCSAQGTRLDLKTPKGWLTEHPLTEAQLARQTKQLRRAGIHLTVDPSETAP